MQLETAVDAGRPRGAVRWATLGGALYVVLFVIGTIVLASGAPSGDSAPAKVIRWYSDSGHRDRVSVGWILIGLGIFFLLWFIAALRRVVRAVDGDGIFTAVVTIGGATYAALAFGGAALNSGIRKMSDDTFQHRVYPELIHAADDVGYVMHATGGAALGAMIIAASLALMGAAVWPRWAGWLGVVVGILAIGSIFFFTPFLFLVWILIVSLLMFMRPASMTRSA